MLVVPIVDDVFQNVGVGGFGHRVEEVAGDDVASRGDAGIGKLFDASARSVGKSKTVPRTPALAARIAAIRVPLPPPTSTMFGNREKS